MLTFLGALSAEKEHIHTRTGVPSDSPNCHNCTPIARIQAIAGDVPFKGIGSSNYANCPDASSDNTDILVDQSIVNSKEIIQTPKSFKGTHLPVTRTVTRCDSPRLKLNEGTLGPSSPEGSTSDIYDDDVTLQTHDDVILHPKIDISPKEHIFSRHQVCVQRSSPVVSTVEPVLEAEGETSNFLSTNYPMNRPGSSLDNYSTDAKEETHPILSRFSVRKFHYRFEKAHNIREIRGSYGIVKLAYNEQDKNLYAMKVLDKMKLLKNFACFRQPPPRRNKSSTAQMRNPLQLVQREIAILKKLSHPNVVRLVEVLDDPSDNYLYMVFEFVERGSILEIPTDKPLDEDTAWKYFRETLRGLEYLHYQKIVHRDIKPSNLLLSETGHVKIADFGVSCEFEGIDAFLSGTAGTPAFMAPEALTEEANHFYSGRAQDIWSLGITLYAFVIGKVPYWNAYIIALHRQIKTDPVIFPDMPHISDLLKDLILGMLKKDPGHRLMLQEVKNHEWVTRRGTCRMLSETENCQLVTVTEEEIENCVRVIPRLDTLILVKAMGHRKRFGNPFRQNSESGSFRERRKSNSVKDSKYVPSSPQVVLDKDTPTSENGVSELNGELRGLSLACVLPNGSPLSAKAATARQ